MEAPPTHPTPDGPVLVPELVPETRVHPHAPEERAELFRAHDGGSTEIEYLELLAALVRCAKPRRVLETGAFLGHGTVVLARAVEANGLGEVVSIERDPRSARAVRALLTRHGLARAEVVEADSLAYLFAAGEPFDLAFLDSCLTLRARELDRLLARRLLTPGALVAIHDTSRRRCDHHGAPDPQSAELWRGLEEVIERHGVAERLELPLSRGLLVLRVGDGV